MNWLWIGLAVVALALGVEFARRRMQAMTPTTRAWGLAGTAGATSAEAFGVIYLPALLITGLAAGLGTVPASAIGALPLFAAGGFCVALLAIALVRLVHESPRLREILMICAIVGLLGLVLARTSAEVYAAMSLAGIGASVGVLVRTQAVARMMVSGPAAPRHARQKRQRAAKRRQDAGEGGAIGAIYTTFIVGLVALLLLPGALPAPEHFAAATGALTPARWLLLAVAALLYSGSRILPGLLDSATLPKKEGQTLKDRSLWRAIALTTFSVMALKPVEFRIVFILEAHGVPHPVTWASLALLSILPNAVFSRQWGSFVQRHQQRAEGISILATIAGATIGLLSAGLGGWAWRLAFGLAYLLLEVSTTLTWACAETVAVQDATDIRRISVLNGVRYGAGVPVGYVAVIASSEVAGIWVPSVALSGISFLAWVLWPGQGLRPIALALKLGSRGLEPVWHRPRHAKKRHRRGAPPHQSGS